MNLDTQAIQKIGQYVLKSSDLCAQLISERDALLQEKEALRKEAAQAPVAKQESPFKELKVKETVKNMHEAGLIKTSEMDAVCEDLHSNPSVALGLLNKLAEREMFRSTDSLGQVEAPEKSNGSAHINRKSDELFAQLYN